MSDEQKSTTTVPVRRVNLKAAEKEESKQATQPNPPDVDQTDAASRRAASLAKAREAKRIKNQQKHNAANTVTVASEPDVVDRSMDDNDNDTSDNDEPAPVNTNTVPLSSRKRKALLEALLRSDSKEDETEERPRKKLKTTVKNSDDSSLRSFVLDKVIDITKLAAASGVASVGFIILKGIAGSQMTPQNKVGEFSAEWVKQ